MFDTIPFDPCTDASQKPCAEFAVVEMRNEAQTPSLAKPVARRYVDASVYSFSPIFKVR